MIYNIIQPPFTLEFREMSKAELKAYYQWFIQSMPHRIIELKNAVVQTAGFEAWQPDGTPASLDLLGRWLANHVETRKQSKDELDEIKSQLKFQMDISDEELTNRTFSLAIDVGMYLSQVFLRSYPSLSWNQKFGSKNSADYGQPILTGFGPSAFNPVRLMVTLAYSLVDGTKSGARLRELFDIWSKMVK